jgi:hypothetical protein
MYTIDDITKAMLPVIGDSAAAKQILENLANPDPVSSCKNDDIVVRKGELYKVCAHREGLVIAKSWDGTTVELREADIRMADERERASYYNNQIEFIRTSISPFMNFFGMRQLALQIKEEDASNDMSEELQTLERQCFSKLQGIKKLW